MSKLVLGKGLGALIPTEESAEERSQSYRVLPVDKIEPNPMQPRRDFNTDRLTELAESFKQNGIIQPLVVKPNGSGYVIIAGERRYRAARMAGITEVPVIVSEEMDDTRMLELALVENIQRENLNPIELAEAYRKLIEQCGLTQQQLSDKVGKSRTAIANQLRLLTLPDEIKEMVRGAKLTEGHARALLSLTTETEMRHMAEKILDDLLSVREVERRTGRKRGKRLVPKKRMPEIVEVESYLKRLMGTQVKISPGLKRGKIEIEYYGDDDLTRLLELFHQIESK